MYLSSVELDGESTGVTDGLRATPLMDDSGESHNDRCLDTWRAQEVCAWQVRHVMGALEEPLGTCTPCMHHPLRYPFPGKVRHFFDQVVVLKQDWSYENTDFF